MNFFILWSTIIHWVPLVESNSGQKILWSMEPLVKKTLVKSTLWSKILWSKNLWSIGLWSKKKLW